MKEKRSSNHYVNNEKLYNVLRVYKDKYDYAKRHDKPLPPIPNYVGECILLIAKRLAQRDNFSGYSFVEEMESDAIENMVMALNNFDCEKSKSPFSYFTQIAWYAFLRRIETERKQNVVKHKNYVFNLATDLAMEGKLVSAADLELSHRLIDDFDKKRLTKKTKNAIDEVPVADSLEDISLEDGLEDEEQLFGSTDTD